MKRVFERFLLETFGQKNVVENESERRNLLDGRSTRRETLLIGLNGGNLLGVYKVPTATTPMNSRHTENGNTVSNENTIRFQSSNPESKRFNCNESSSVFASCNARDFSKSQ